MNAVSRLRESYSKRKRCIDRVGDTFVIVALQTVCRQYLREMSTAMITENEGPGASTEHPLQGGNQLQNGPTETIDASESGNSGNPSAPSAKSHRSRSGKPYSIKRKLDIHKVT